MQLFVVSVTLRNASGDLLIVRKRGTSVFMLPGGKVEAGESHVEASVRPAGSGDRRYPEQPARDGPERMRRPPRGPIRGDFGESEHYGLTLCNVRGMQRLTATLLVAFCLLLAAPHAVADDVTEWTLEDANLSLSLPSELAVATRAGIQTHPELFEAFGLDDATMEQLMLASNGYLNAIQANVEHEYVVIAVEPPNSDQRIWNFNALSDEVLEQVSESVIKKMTEAGYTSAFEGIVRIEEVAYLVLSGMTAEGYDYRQYHTAVNSRITSITLHSYLGAISDELAAEHLSVVESARFLSIVPDPNPDSDLVTRVDQLQPLASTIRIGLIGLVIAGIVLVVVRIRRRRKRAAATQAPMAQADPGVPAQPVYPPVRPGEAEPSGSRPPGPTPPAPPSGQPTPPAPSETPPPSGRNGPLSG